MHFRRNPNTACEDVLGWLNIDTANECHLHAGCLLFGTQIKQLASLENCIKWQVEIMVQDHTKESDFTDRQGRGSWCILYIFLHLSLHCLQWMNTDVENNPLSRFVPDKSQTSWERPIHRLYWRTGKLPWWKRKLLFSNKQNLHQKHIRSTGENICT